MPRLLGFLYREVISAKAPALIQADEPINDDQSGQLKCATAIRCAGFPPSWDYGVYL
jgi:hypothetical protein